MVHSMHSDLIEGGRLQGSFPQISNFFVLHYLILNYIDLSWVKFCRTFLDWNVLNLPGTSNGLADPQIFEKKFPLLFDKMISQERLPKLVVLH